MCLRYRRPEQRNSMDREPEDFQFLGSVGIIKEAFKILLSYAKLLGVLALTLILPLSFAILGLNLVSDLLLDNILCHELVTYQENAGTLSCEKIMWEWTELIVFLAVYALCVLAFSLLSTAAAVNTVASIYKGNEVSYARVISVFPRVWKRLIVTFLWYFVLVIAYTAATISTFFLLIFAVTLNTFNFGVFYFCLTLITAVVLCVHVYISMVWHLACVISVLEDKSGRGAMRKSKELIKGKWITALTLGILYLIFGGIIGWYFRHDVVWGWYYGMGSAERRAHGALLAGLLCFVNLMGLLIQSVFYFVCNSYHDHESIDQSCLSDHPEVDLGDCVPLKNSNIQLEDLHALVK